MPIERFPSLPEDIVNLHRSMTNTNSHRYGHDLRETSHQFETSHQSDPSFHKHTIGLDNFITVIESILDERHSYRTDPVPHSSLK